MAKLFMDTPGTEEGKYLVMRRDGTIPAWPHFVIAASDPDADGTLRDYARRKEQAGADPAYVASVRALALMFESWREQHGVGDPEAGPHRKDLPAVIAMMRHGHDKTYTPAAEKDKETGKTTV